VSGAAEEEKDAEFAHEDYTLVVTELQIGVKFKRAAGVKQEVDSLSKEKTSLADNISGIKEKLSDAYSKADDKDALAKEKSDEARSKDYQLDGLRGELSDEKEEVKAKSEAIAKIASELEGAKASAEEACSNVVFVKMRQFHSLKIRTVLNLVPFVSHYIETFQFIETFFHYNHFIPYTCENKIRQFTKTPSSALCLHSSL
jgi:chromosome segregation ATPase